MKVLAPCPQGECDRMFDLADDIDFREWAEGHDCEV